MVFVFITHELRATVADSCQRPMNVIKTHSIFIIQLGQGFPLRYVNNQPKQLSTTEQSDERGVDEHRNDHACRGAAPYGFYASLIDKDTSARREGQSSWTMLEWSPKIRTEITNAAFGATKSMGVRPKRR